MTAESEGEKLFKSNNPSAAVFALENEIKTGQISVDTYNFLGLAYFQMGDFRKSIDAFERGQKESVGNRKLLCFNEGNVAYVSGDYEKAENCFSLALVASPSMYNALLNRANARLMLKKYSDCLVDYKKYIEDVPDDPQKPEILRLIAYLEEQIEFDRQEAIRLAEEQKRIEEENKRMQEELARQEEERKRLEEERRIAEEERRRKLLEDVASSLQQTDTTNMTAGAETVLEYENESELD